MSGDRVVSGGTTVNDVAARAGVSRQTVSNVLNAPERVREATRLRVEAAIEELGYRPHWTARNLRSRSTRLLGYRVPPTRGGAINAVLDRFFHALADAAQVDGYQILLFTPGEGGDETRAYDELMATRTVDGFVVSETNYGDTRITHLLEGGIPFAAFGRTDLDRAYPSVDVDNAAGTRLAVEHLVERGRRRIAYVGWPEGSITGDERFRGYREALADAGLVDDPRLHARGEDGTEAGRAAANRWFGLSAPPDAVVAASDLLAIGVLEAARARGLAVGSDVSVTGFDDTPTAQFLSPALTSVRQPLEEVAAAVVRLLTDRIGGAPPSRNGLLIAPRLIVRHSS